MDICPFNLKTDGCLVYNNLDMQDGMSVWCTPVSLKGFCRAVKETLRDSSAFCARICR